MLRVRKFSGTDLHRGEFSRYATAEIYLPGLGMPESHWMQKPKEWARGLGGMGWGQARGVIQIARRYRQRDSKAGWSGAGLSTPHAPVSFRSPRRSRHPYGSRRHAVGRRGRGQEPWDAGGL